MIQYGRPREGEGAGDGGEGARELDDAQHRQQILRRR